MVSARPSPLLNTAISYEMGRDAAEAGLHNCEWAAALIMVRFGDARGGGGGSRLDRRRSFARATKLPTPRPWVARSMDSVFAVGRLDAGGRIRNLHALGDPSPCW
jgi:hypothetical protein